MVDLVGLRDSLASVCHEHLDADETEAVLGLARPAVRLLHTRQATSSHLGGTAMLPTGTPWPTNAVSRPLRLLCMLDLHEFAGFEVHEDRPTKGLVNVFYDLDELPENLPEGYDPLDDSGWAVLGADVSSAVERSHPSGKGFERVGVEGAQALTIPSPGEPVLGPLSDVLAGYTAAMARYYDLWFAWEDWQRARYGGPWHQLGGWPALEQNTFWWQCEAVSSGWYVGNDENGHSVQFPVDGTYGWDLVVQLHSDDSMGAVFGDGGTLYVNSRRPFTFPVEQARTWLIMQD